MSHEQLAKSVKLEKQSDLQVAEKVFKDIHMTGRAMRIDESPEDYQRERETSWPHAWEQIKKEKGWIPSETVSATGAMNAAPQEYGAEKADQLFAHVPQERRELAKYLAGLSQDEYAEWLTKHMLEETDLYNQLTARPEYRSLLGQERALVFVAVKDTPEYAQYRQRVEELDQFWLLKKKQAGSQNIRTVGSGEKWSNFEINKGAQSAHSESKGYLTFKKPAEALTPENVSSFMRRLQEAGYNGQVKVPTMPSALFFRFDNIVFHGDTDADVDKALQVAEQLFGGQLTQTQKGTDGINANGSHTSHSDLLAEKVKKTRAESNIEMKNP